MKKYKIYTLSALALFVLATVSCVKEAEVPQSPDASGAQAEVVLKFSNAPQYGSGGAEIIPLDPRSDIGQQVEEKVNNVWVFQFAAQTPVEATPLVGLPRYANIVEGEETVMNLAISETDDHTLVFVANLGDTFQWNLAAGATYADVMAKTAEVSSESGITDGGLSMSGKYVGTISEQSVISALLYRNVAKIELDLKPAAGCEIKSVQLCNVPAAMSPFEGLAARTSAAASDISTISYDAVDYQDGADITGGKAFVFYAPANLQGEASSPNSDESKKNEYAPESATYFHIVAKEAGADDDISFFLSIYPGADNTEDFNIAANRHYVYTLAVNSLDDFDEDSRVETDGPVRMQLANSYIINPIPDNYQYDKRSLLIPVSRINTFWGGSLAGYGNTPANVIGAEDIWTAELLWQDQAAMVAKSTSDEAPRITIGKNADEIAAGKSFGTGPDGGFVINIPKKLTSSNYGNFVVVVKKGTDGSGPILWSWHFWVTDYNPDKQVAVGRDTVYTVPGGEVHRYHGAMWGYGAAPDYAYSDAVSATTPYAQSVIMDRNLGIIDQSTYGGANYGRGKLYYQFGRKDPSPGNISLYDISGTALGTDVWNNTNTQAGVNANYVGEQVTLKKAVNNPLTFYAINGNYDWTSDTEVSGKTNFLWFDPAAPATSLTTAKSIYDPCPPGWRLPVNGVWTDFSTTNSVGDGEAKKVTYGGYAVFYLDGYRRYDHNARTADGGSRVFMRTATCSDAYRAPVMILRYASSTLTVTPVSQYNTASGYSVRCISH